MKIKSWDLTIKWEDGEEHSISDSLPLGIITEIEQVLDYIEAEEND